MELELQVAVQKAQKVPTTVGFELVTSAFELVVLTPWLPHECIVHGHAPLTVGSLCEMVALTDPVHFSGFVAFVRVLGDALGSVPVAETISTNF